MLHVHGKNGEPHCKMAASNMIFIGLGGNLVSTRFGGPMRTGDRALTMLCDGGAVRLVRRSRWYWSHPVPASDQPLYANAVAQVATHMGAAALLARLQAVEMAMGRVRGARNAARVLDLDLLAYGPTVVSRPGMTVPHPRMLTRGFVMLPLAELAPGWRHPVTGALARDVAAAVAGAAGGRAAWPVAFGGKRRPLNPWQAWETPLYKPILAK